MSKKTAVLVLLIIMVLIKPVRSEQVVSIGFEGFQVIDPGVDGKTFSYSSSMTDWTTVWSATISLATEKFLKGLWIDPYVYIGDGQYDWSESITVYVRILINGVEVWSWAGTYNEIVNGVDLSEEFRNPNLFGSNFNIEIQLKYSGDFLTGTYFKVQRLRIYAISEDISGMIKSKLLEMKYIPPGADETAQGFILNQTEIVLNQSLSLSEGTVSFYLKWDGSTDIKISDNIGIDSNGYLYVTSSDGTKFTLEVNPPIGEYVPVYIGWGLGEGYIMINTTKVSLAWSGNLTITKIGDIGNDAGTIIDEFKVWNEYIPPDIVTLEAQKQSYFLILNTTSIEITPEGGTTLPAIDVTFLGQNMTVINTTTLSPGSKIVTVPGGTEKIVLTAGSVSRSYLLDRIPDKIAFPAEDTSVSLVRIIVRPTQFEKVEIKTVDGRLVERDYLQNNEISVPLLYGNQYIFVFEIGNITRARVYTPSTSEIIFYILPEDLQFKPPVDVRAFVENGTIVVSYYDENMETSWIDVTITGYELDKEVFQIHDRQERQFGLYILKTDSDCDYATVLIKANISGSITEFKRTVYVKGSAQSGPFPTFLVPPALLVLGFSLIPMFLFRAIEPHMMLLGGAIGLAVGVLLGWIPAQPELITLMTVLAVMAFITYVRR